MMVARTAQETLEQCFFGFLLSIGPYTLVWPFKLKWPNVAV